MKKILSILISLLFVLSVFGVASTMAGVYSAVATPENVKVGELITVTTTFYSCIDPVIIADGNKPKGDAVLVSRPDMAAGIGLTPVEIPIEVNTYTWVYRATEPGTIIFDFGPPAAAKINGNIVSNPVTITSNSLPMLNFMKILGFGNESA